MKLKTRDVVLSNDRNRARYDCIDMEQWADGYIDADTLAIRLTDRNEIDPPLTADEAEQFAHGSGFWIDGTMPKDILDAIYAYGLYSSPYGRKRVRNGRQI